MASAAGATVNIGNVTRSGSVLLAGLSLLSLTWQAYNFGLSEAFSQVLGFYQSVRELFGGVVSAGIDFLNVRFGVDLYLDPHWFDAFLLLAVLHASELHTRRDSAPFKRIFVSVSGISLSLVCALAVGLTYSDTTLGAFLSVLIFGLSVVVYTISITVFYAFFGRLYAASKWRQLWINTKEKLPALVYAIAIPGVAFAGLDLLGGDHEIAFTTAIILSYAGICGFWLQQAFVYKARSFNQAGWNQLYRALSDELFSVFFVLSSGMLALLVFLMLNAGLRYLNI